MNTKVLAQAIAEAYALDAGQQNQIVVILNKWNGEAKEGNRQVQSIANNFCNKDVEGLLKILSA